MAFRFRYVDAEARTVYAADERARQRAPRPLRDARAVTALVRRIERMPEFGGERVHVSHAGRSESRGGVKFTHGRKPTKRDLNKAMREGRMTHYAARSAWDARVQEYYSRPWQNEYFVRIAPNMRDAYTVTHEMAHVLQAMQIAATMTSGRLGHGPDFRALHIAVAEALDPEMARMLLEEYTRAGLEVVLTPDVARRMLDAYRQTAAEVTK